MGLTLSPFDVYAKVHFSITFEDPFICLSQGLLVSTIPRQKGLELLVCSYNPRVDY